MEKNIQSQPQQPSQHTNLLKILMILVISIGFISTFIGGYVLSTIMSSEKNVTTEINPNPTMPIKTMPTSTQSVAPRTSGSVAQIPQDSTKFLPGKHYFEDTILLVTKDKPQRTFVATVDRVEQDTDYAQSTRMSYYDGSNWIRQSDSKAIPDSTIVSNSLVKSWTTNTDPTRVLKQTAQGEIAIANTSLQFTTGILQNEIGIRSLPDYTKFSSTANGTLTINGKAHPAYVLYTRIYSLNASDIQFYNQPFGVTTDWIAFWDTQGNFYHIDATSVDKPTPIYQSHQLGIMEDGYGSVTKTFTVSITRDTKNPPTHYTITMNVPSATTLTFDRINGVNKAPNGSFTWYMGNIAGTVQKPNGQLVHGIGVMEYIHD